jgi:hypothetical protein
MNAHRLYWFESRAIRSIPKTGGPVESVPHGFAVLADVAVDESDVFFSENDSGYVYRIAPSGGLVTRVGYGFPASWNNLALNSSNVLWMTQGEAGKGPKAGGLPIDIAVFDSDVSLPDAILADDETIYFTNVVTGSIVQARQAPTNTVEFALANVSVSESAGQAVITVRRLGDVSRPTSVTYRAASGSALPGGDFTPVSGTLVFSGRAHTARFSVPILDDPVADGTKTVLLSLGHPDGCALRSDPETAVLSIADDDRGGTIEFASARYEVSEGTASALITVTRSGGTAAAVTVDYETVGGSAVPGVDYTPTSGTLTFGRGVSRLAFSVPILDDGAVGGNQVVGLLLDNPGGGGLLGARSAAELAIQETNSVFQFSAPNYSISEGAPRATVTVRRLGPAAAPASVAFQTADGTAVAGEGYEAASGTLSFNAGATVRTFTVRILEDRRHQAGETVLLRLESPSAGSALGAQSTAVLSIADNDPPGTLTFGSGSYEVTETAGGARITVRRKAGTAEGVVVRFDVTGGTATPGVDYTPVSGDLAFAAAGPGSVSQTFEVPILDDGVPDTDKTVRLTLSDPRGGGVLGNPATADLLIRSADAIVQFGAPTFRAQEGGRNPVIVVRRSGPATGAVGVAYETSGGSATPLVDYEPAAGVLTFGPGQATRTFTLPLLRNPSVEADETIGLVLGDPLGAALGPQSEAEVVIGTDDPALQFRLPVYRVSESAGQATIHVRRLPPLTGAVSVEYETEEGTAQAGVDYQPSTGTVSFASGAASRTFTVPILDDATDGPGAVASLVLNLRNPVGAYLGSPSVAALEIGDDDAAGTVQFVAGDLSVREAAGYAAVTVRRTGGEAAGASIWFETLDGTAVAGTHYGAVGGWLVFAAGETEVTVLVPIVDNGSTASRRMGLRLADPQGGAALGATSAATLWIIGSN